MNDAGQNQPEFDIRENRLDEIRRKLRNSAPFSSLAFAPQGPLYRRLLRRLAIISSRFSKSRSGLRWSRSTSSLEELPDLSASLDRSRIFWAKITTLRAKPARWRQPGLPSHRCS